MNLQGRNLELKAPPMQGEDVALLHRELRQLGFAIPPAEIEGRIFRKATQQAVQGFQATHGLPETGVVDEQTASAINAAVDALQPQRFIVKGQIRLQDGSPPPKVTVKAFDTDLRSVQLLGEDNHNPYEIIYTANRFRRAEKESADLFVQCENAEGTLFAKSETLFNAPPVATVDLVIVPRTETQLSEFERYMRQLTPLWEGQGLAEGEELAHLTAEDIAFLVGETGIDWQHIEFLRQSAQLSQESALPTEAFYGWAREGLLRNAAQSRNLEQLLAQLLTTRPQTLRRALETAIERRIIPQRVQEMLEAIMKRLEELRGERGLLDGRNLVSHEVIGQLLNQETGAPLSGFTVRAFDLDADTEPRSLGADVTDHRGLFPVMYTTPRDASGSDGGANKGERRIRLHILDSQAQEIHRAEIAAKAEQEQVLEVRVPAPPAPESPTPTITELAAAAQLALPEGLLTHLAEKNIHTLAGIRKAGGLSHLEGLPVAADDPVVLALEAHASLSMLSSDINLNANLIEKRLTSVLAVANAPRTRVVAAARETLGDFKAAEMHVEARAQKSFLDNKMMGMMALSANGYVDDTAASEFGPINAILPKKCGCEDCESAVSPLAYLADLLDYAVEHLEKKDGTAVTLQFLTNTFCQPFGDLPAACEEMDKKVRQVRICIEVLRRYLKAKKLPLGNSNAKKILDSEEKTYRLETYKLLLTKLGTSYEEIRLARTQDADRREALADRLGIELGTGTPDNLGALFLDPAAQPEPIPEQELETLFGLVDTDKPNPLAEIPTPEFLKWRLAHLRMLWKEQDRPTDQYSVDFLPAEERLPVIDPDVIGPDDFRHPFAKADPNAPNQVFDIWLRRRKWVDDRLEALSNLKETNGQQVPDLQALKAMLSSMYEQISYGDTSIVDIVPWVNTQPAAFEQLLDNLNKGTDLEATKATIHADLSLDVDSFTRLMAIRAKAQLTENDSKNEAVTDEEWVEAYSILTQAQKTRLFAHWITEEVTQGHLFGPTEFFGPQEFWVSLREPREGDWPPVLGAELLLIDPEILKLDDLPDPTVGKRARELWEARRKKLEEIRNNLKTVREAQANVADGFNAVLHEALGDPNPGDPLPNNLNVDTLNSNLTDPTPAVVEGAQNTIQTDLHMAVEDFTRLMTIKLKTGPTAEEWDEVYALLTSAQKAKREFDGWRSEENDPATGVVYWSALKARLPRWRATAEARQKWLQALRIRSRAPLIDPDLISKDDDLKEPNTGPASALWNARKNEIKAQLDGLKAEAQTADGLETIIQQAVGVPAEELKALNEARQEGEDIEPRLEQLSLTADAFSYLLRILELAENPQPVVLPSEWDEVYSILVQVQKRRAFARWREGEKEQDLILGPDHFKFPEVNFTAYPPLPSLELLDWRATWEARRDWQDTLQSRIDQEKAVIEALQEAVSATEEATLPRLRDALVMASDAKGASLEEKAKWVTDKLLIDAKASGCQVTTRISQAIETIQGILFSVRTGQLQDTHPLELEADHFDEEWEWIGSYATWRAAMFVFLYPENILLPSLRRWQTPAFRTLVRNLRSNRRLTSEQAHEAAHTYSEYFEDIGKLNVEASCDTRTHIYRTDSKTGKEIGPRCLFYMFGRGPATSTVYWSAYDPQDTPDYAQTFWEAVPGVAKAIKVLGAAPYEISPEERFIYLFAITLEKAAKKLVFTKYDLEKQRWDDEPTELELPEEATDFTAVVKQSFDEKNPPHLAIRLPSGTIYGRKLSPDGSGWADEDWKPLVGRLRGAGLSNVPGFTEVVAMVEIAPDEFYLLVRNIFGTIEYRLFGPNDDGQWQPIYQKSFLGALAWPDTSDLYLFYEGYQAQMLCRVITRSNNSFTDEEIRYIGEFDWWLQQVTGLSLKQLTVPEGSPYAGMTLYEFLRLEPGKEEYPLVWGLVEAILKFHKIYTLSWLDGKIQDASDYIDEVNDESDDFASWKLADELIQEFSNTQQSIEGVLTGILTLYPGKVTNSETGEQIGFTWGGNSFSFRIRNEDSIKDLTVDISGMSRILPSSGAGKSASARQYVHQRAGGQVGVYRCGFQRSGNMLTPSAPSSRIIPHVTGPYEVTEQLSEFDRQVRGELSEQNFKDNESGPRSSLTYLEEANYFVPIHLALQLQQRGQYTAALDWFRTVYDYSVPKAQRKIYYGLKKEESNSPSSQYERSEEDWLLDPLNPHAIAETRRKTYTRFTLLSLVRCFLEFADAEFTRDTAESVPRARTLYMTALELLETDDLKQKLNGCTDLIGELDIEVGNAQGVSSFNMLNVLKKDLTGISDYRVLEETVDNIKTVLDGPGTLETRFAQARNIVAQAVGKTPEPPVMAAVVEGKAARLAKAHAALIAQPEMTQATQKVGDAAALDFKHRVSLVAGVGEATLENKSTEFPWLRQKMPVGIAGNGIGPEDPIRMSFGADGNRNQSLRRLNPLAPTRIGREAQIGFTDPLFATNVININPSVWFSPPSFEFCVPPNPIIKMLRLRTELNLYKLRNCRNIAGMVRELDPYAAPTDTVSGLPMIGAGGQLVLPGAIKFTPTPYRYPVLIERAKHLVGLAQQIEAAFLAALEKGDAERYSLLKARQDVRLSRAGVRLQVLRVKEAEGDVKLAELQQERAQIEADHYKQLLDQSLSELELQSLGLMLASATIQNGAAMASFVGAGLPTGFSTTGVPEFSPAGSASAIASGLSSIAGFLSTQASMVAAMADYERRAQGWEFQRNLALHDVKIGTQQIKIAEDHVRVVGQERVIAEMQAEQAEAVVDFLSNKFTNVELYDWMSDVLESVYSFFLQQATAMAQLAASQLAFERQEIPPPFIQADYWEAPSDDGMGSNTDGKAPDRRGLTGSTRLLQDVYQLDQYAFETNERKLQLTKTISLQQLAPTEFQRFRETGVITFATPMEMFDREFPGHYLRLIRRVKTSVVALVPPTQGIRATLSTAATSRVVIGGDIFQTVVLNRGPQLVALNSPRDATGLFELEQQSEMLLPFEGLGVDTTWELRMPKAANLFDYRTVADVLITIEYTALNNFDYYQQVIQSLKPNLSANRPFSFRHQFADQWYDLHNPDQTTTPMTVRFTTVRDDFPPNLENLKIQHAVLYFARMSGKSFEVPVTHFRFTEQGGPGFVGGGATSIDGVISTRNGNAGSWSAMLGKAPVGEWELALPDTQEMKKRFKNEEIEDILFVITYSGHTPEWPA